MSIKSRTIIPSAFLEWAGKDNFDALQRAADTIEDPGSTSRQIAAAARFVLASARFVWVYIEYDIQKTDAYDRHLAYIWLEDGSLFNLTLLEKGYGKFLVIAPNVKYSAFLIYAQKAAKNAQVGVWSPLPEVVEAIDLANLTDTELILLRERISEELLSRLK